MIVVGVPGAISIPKAGPPNQGVNGPTAIFDKSSKNPGAMPMKSIATPAIPKAAQEAGGAEIRSPAEDVWRNITLIIRT